MAYFLLRQASFIPDQFMWLKLAYSLLNNNPTRYSGTLLACLSNSHAMIAQLFLGDSNPIELLTELVRLSLEVSTTTKRDSITTEYLCWTVGLSLDDSTPIMQDSITILYPHYEVRIFKSDSLTLLHGSNTIEYPYSVVGFSFLDSNPIIFKHSLIPYYLLWYSSCLLGLLARCLLNISNL